jgi:dethiobiotin synthetase
MTARGFFIAGTDTGVGKTRVTTGLLTAWAERGTIATGMKPVAAGKIEHECRIINEDVRMIEASSTLSVTTDEIATYHLNAAVSPHIAARREGVEIDLLRIASGYARLAARAAVVLVEGTGGWLAPISDHHTMADVAMSLGLPVVLVVGLRLGCLNHALLTSQAIAQAGLPLAGWIGSLLDPAMLELDANLETLAARLPPARLALLPFDPTGRGDRVPLRAAAAALAP